MEIYRDILNLQANNPTVTVGTFDGLHAGHRELIRKMKEVAADNGSETIIFTFWPHPRLVLGDTGDTKLLNTLEEKIALLDQQNIDHLIIYPFTKEFSQLSAYDFVNEVLVKKIGVKHLVVGFDLRQFALAGFRVSHQFAKRTDDQVVGINSADYFFLQRASSI